MYSGIEIMLFKPKNEMFVGKHKGLGLPKFYMLYFFFKEQYFWFNYNPFVIS